MGYFKTRGLRGSNLEEYINLTNEKYREHGLGLVQKIPTPIKPVELDSQNGNIKKAYFEERSTVDYIGVVQGYPICFDAKETNMKSFPMKNIHDHQMNFMNDFEKQEGIAFFIINFSAFNKMVLVPYSFVKEQISIAKQGGRKSLSYEDCCRFYEIKNKDGYIVHYIEALDRFLAEKPE